ncbi:MAG: hypothetical protein HYU43_00855 [Armatimonadetes bacterium]|nr:hypothetical protein [Planctomycetota bacterium]MBI2200476.1 hypothetical protein [Armatimonadota bacterium]
MKTIAMLKSRGISITGLLALLTLGHGCQGPSRQRFGSADPPAVLKRVVARWDNGQPMTEETYYKKGRKREIRHGPYTYFFENGLKRLVVEYRDGKRHGPMTEWNEAGEVVQEGSWEDDLRAGSWTAWHGPGKKLWECTYRAGTIVGRRIFYHAESGKMSRLEVYDDQGTIQEVTGWHPAGPEAEPVRKFHGAYLRGRKHGMWTYWRADGQVESVGEWREDKPWEGLCVVLPRGNLGDERTLENYHEGKPHQSAGPR